MQKINSEAHVYELSKAKNFSDLKIFFALSHYLGNKLNAVSTELSLLKLRIEQAGGR